MRVIFNLVKYAVERLTINLNYTWLWWRNAAVSIGEWLLIKFTTCLWLPSLGDLVIDKHFAIVQAYPWAKRYAALFTQNVQELILDTGSSQDFQTDPHHPQIDWIGH